MVKIAAMQPYLLPYIGYWQLIEYADIFVLLDDVNYIKRGWINRNRIFCQGKEQYFVLPVQNASQNRIISDHRFLNKEKTVSDLLNTFRLAYGKAPYLKEVLALLDGLIRYPNRNVADFLENTLRGVCRYLGIETPILRSSCLRQREHPRAQAGIIQLVRYLDGDEYVNPIGGVGLYDPAAFQREGICLHFLKTDFEKLTALTGQDRMEYSIADLLFRFGTAQVREMLHVFDLI